MSHVLVTGGAGYIGSHACKMLAARGHIPVTVDNLSTGWAEAVKYGPLIRADLADRAALDAAFARYRPVAVVHFAAFSLVGEAMADPGKYWRNNVVGSLGLIEAALAADCRSIVFSSTCATYGEHDGVTLDEGSPQQPLNSYGSSKRAVEEMLRDFGASQGLNAVIFRYFNVAGADPGGEIGEWHQPETHLIPLILQAIDGQRPELVIHGDDYATPDGTCIRDYVHVMDLVEAHVLGLDWLAAGRGSRVFNLGTGTGFSVREVIDAAEAVTGRKVPYRTGPRRGGDATRLVSGSRRAAEELGWAPRRSTLEQMIGDAWNWHRNGGYQAGS
ncbi:UDP-glucose 4-epimerase GalE [Pararhodobacter sp. SW119]|uniref:UDP-glucose 4-epimerase GalE n=1 Tax=Pararhodobacter sp. SW119 TaxID=2780075 RepID=UPI001ADEFD5F|nr:UDP-glucose 4-epimerase GalE [Pararhodobacter sp. SW119]